MVYAVAATIAGGWRWEQSARGAEPRVYAEDEAKVLLIRSLVSYTSWPAEAFPGPDAPFVIGIYGENPFGDLLNSFKGKRIKNRRIEVKELKNLDNVGSVQLLFVSSAESRWLGAITEKLKDSSVLTVGDSEAFNKLGGIVKLTPRNDMKFEISKTAKDRARGLEFKPELLKVAKPVN